MNRTGRFFLPTVSVFALIVLPIAAFGQSMGQEQTSATAAGEWMVTVGAWTFAQPSFEGSDELAFAVRPLLNIWRRGTREWLSLPTDHGGATFFSTGNFRVGPSLNFIQKREDGDHAVLHGLGTVDWALEAGAFAEFWPTERLRTRFEIRRGFNGHEGFVADLSADGVWRLAESWTLTGGPRLSLADREYMNTYFSVSPGQAIASGLTPFDAKAGLKSAGSGSSLIYQWTPQFATTAFVEYERLLGDAAKSPIVTDRGSPDQFTIGIGAKYTFSVGTPNWQPLSRR
jgi:outer membrane scaffolding protein for murein synthesis (MipA/OmpV family)